MTIRVRVPAPLHQAVEAYAADEQLTVSDAVREALLEFFVNDAEPEGGSDV